MPGWLRRCQTLGKNSNHCSFTAQGWPLHRRAPQASAGLLGQDIHAPSSTVEGRGPSHPAIQSSFRGEAKQFKASGCGDPSHKSRWMLAPNSKYGHQNCPWLTDLPLYLTLQLPQCTILCVANMPSFIFPSSTTADNQFLWLEKCHGNAGTHPLGCSTYSKAVCDSLYLVLVLWVHRRKRNHSAKDNPGLWLCHTAWHRTAVNLL